MAAGFVAHHLGNGFPAGIDHAHRATGVATVRLRLAFHREHPCAKRGGNLDRGLANLAIAAGDQHHVARLGHAGAAQSFISRNERHAHGTGFDQRDGVRLGAHGLRADAQVLAVRTVAANAKLAATAPHLLPDQLARAIDNNACVVASRRTWPDGMRHQSERGLDIAGIHARANHFDNALARARLWPRHPDQRQLERVDGRSFPLNLNGVHDVWMISKV